MDPQLLSVCGEGLLGTPAGTREDGQEREAFSTEAAGRSAAVHIHRPPRAAGGWGGARDDRGLTVKY